MTYSPEQARRLVEQWQERPRRGSVSAAIGTDMLDGKWVGLSSVRARGVDVPTFQRVADILPAAGYEIEEAEMKGEYRYRVRQLGDGE